MFPKLWPKSLSGDSAIILQQWVDYGKACIQPGLEYFLAKFQQQPNVSFLSSRLHFVSCKTVHYKTIYNHPYMDSQFNNC